MRPNLVPFTKENAGEMARRATQARLARIAREKEEEELERARWVRAPRDTTEDAKKIRVQRQIEACDTMIEACKDPEMFVKLITAKARLWELLYPKPGSLRPKSSRSERAPVAPVQPLPAPAAPQPVANPPALVVPTDPQNHNGENVQS
ncbi:MAG TPA: hypothetical protein VLK33_19150 [Terriglobales bacterium]|nr:hypothetical protein [Terriglobales bacterium]